MKKLVWVTLFISVLISGCLNLKCAYVPESFITEGWYENTSLRNTGLQFLGLQKWCSLTYEKKGAYLSVISVKALMLADEEKIEEKVIEIIEDTFKDKMKLNLSVTGKRMLKKHESRYVVYNGENKESEGKERVKIIGEVWNCASSGISVICIGLAYVDEHNNWKKIVMDPRGSIGFKGEEGLIYNVCCH
jgi:predicted small secreted protein